MKIVALDPSYSNTGICIVDTDAKSIDLFCLSSDKVGSRGFKGYIARARKLVVDIRRNLIERGISDSDMALSNDDVMFVSEEPIPQSIVAGAMNTLASAIFLGLPIRYSTSPSYLSALMGKHTKAEAVELVKCIFDRLITQGWTVPAKFRHDMAEAFLISLVLSSSYFKSIGILFRSTAYNDTDKYLIDWLGVK